MNLACKSIASLIRLVCAIHHEPMLLRVPLMRSSSPTHQQASLETMQQQLVELANREAQKREAATKLRSEIEAASTRIAAGPGWTTEQEVISER